MKNNKKKIILLACIVLCVVFVLAILLANNTSGQENKEKLILDCSKSTEVNGFNMTLTKKLYSLNDGMKYIEGMHSNIKSEYLKGEDLNNYYEQQELVLKEKVNKAFGENYKYVSVITEISGESATFNIEYTINDKSKDYITKKLSVDVYNMSINELLEKLKEDGFDCKSF